MVEPAPARNLFDLPLEIQNMIFELAYPRPAWNRKLIRRAQWMERDKKRRDDVLNRSEQRPPFEYKINIFLVSKDWFVRSTISWVHNLTSFDTGCLHGFLATKADNLFVQSARKVTVQCSVLAPTSELRMQDCHFWKMEILMGTESAATGVFGDRKLWEEQLTPDELRCLPLMDRLLANPRLRRVEMKVVGQILDRDRPIRERVRWNVNVWNLCKLISGLLDERWREGMLASKSRALSEEERTGARACQPLYYGSRVCALCNSPSA